MAGRVKRGSPPGGGRSGREALRRRALDLVRRARGLARLLARVEGLGLPREEILHAPLGFSLSAGRDEQAARALLVGLREGLQSLAFREETLLPGKVFCFRCGSLHCAHASPRDPREVFTGYSPTGRPKWLDFVSWCIDRREARVESLLQDRNRVIALVQGGGDLHKDQLGVFGGEDPAYRILGQVTAGFFSRPGREGGGPPFALTVQALRLRDSRGEPRLVLNSLSAGTGPEEDPALREILGRTRKSLELVSLRIAGMEKSGSRADPEEMILPLLRALARDMEHESLGRARRTNHGRRRARQGERPTEAAYPEARKAQDEEILVDTLEGTVVVLGARNRVHVFTRDARHVTSFHMAGDLVRKRIHRRRWRGADPAERGAFRGALRARRAEEREEEPPGKREDREA